MDIDFDKWNSIKKAVNEKTPLKCFFFREREIWWCSLGVNVGVETNGKHDLFERPVLIFKVFNREMLWIMPITSTKKTSVFYYSFESNMSTYYINITQIRTISAKRLSRKIGSINEKDYLNVITMISNLIKNETPPTRRGISEPEGDNGTIISK